MSAFLPPGGGPDGGGGFRFRVPQDVFAGNTKALAVAARNAGLNAGDLSEFDADPSLLIILDVGDVDIYQARRANQWRDVANVAPGQPGPPGASPDMRSLTVRATNDDRSSYGASYTIRRSHDDFYIVTTTTDSHPNVELTVEAGREIYDWYWDGVGVMDLAVKVAGARSWTMVVGAGGAEFWVRTRASG